MNKKLADLLKSKVLANSAWLIILQVFNTIVPLLTLPYITRVLGTSNYGVFSLALNWVTYFQVIVEYGFGFTGARKVSIHGDESLQELYSRIITARIFLLFGTFLTMNILSAVLHVSRAQYISMNILFLIILGVAFQLTWLFQRQTGHEIDCYYQCGIAHVLGTDGFCTGTQRKSLVSVLHLLCHNLPTFCRSWHPTGSKKIWSKSKAV